MILEASWAYPVHVYYCKAGLKNGTPIRVWYNGNLWGVEGVRLEGTVLADMSLNNTIGPAARSGARVALVIVQGTVKTDHPVAIDCKECTLADLEDPQ